MENNAPVLLVALRGFCRAVINAFRTIDTIPFLEDILAVAFCAAVIIADDLIDMAMPRIQAFGCVCRNTGSHRDAMLGVIETEKFALSAATAMGSAPSRTFVLADDN